MTLAQATDSGPLIASAVIKLFYAMKLPAQELRGVGIQVQQLEGARSGPVDHKRSIKEMLLGAGLPVRPPPAGQQGVLSSWWGGVHRCVVTEHTYLFIVCV